MAADTGEFICQPFNEDSKDTNIKNATAYIFVSGMAEESLFLKKKEALWVMLRAGYSGYINCRVTVPSAQPKLKSSANNEDFTNYGIYDPR